MLYRKSILDVTAITLTFQAAKPDVLSKRDSSVETHHFAENTVDPYAAYYEQYAQQVPSAVSEKQGFAHSMESALGPDAAVSLTLVWNFDQFKNDFS